MVHYVIIIPDETHAGVGLGSVEAETKSVVTVQVCQYEGEVLLILTV